MAPRDSTPIYANVKSSTPAESGRMRRHLAPLNDDVLTIVFRFILATVKEHFSTRYQGKYYWRESLHRSFLSRPPFVEDPLVHQRTALALVCRQWSRVALSSGTLAARLVDPSQKLDRFNRLLHASQNVNLVVDFDDYLQRMAEVLYGREDSEATVLRPNEQFITILKNVHRLMGVNFCTEDPFSTKCTVPLLKDVLSNHAPKLEVLVIRTPMTDNAMGNQLRMQAPYTFQPSDPFLGNRESSLRCLVLEDHFVIPSPTNPAFDNLRTLKISTCTSYMFVSTILPWLERGSNGGLRSLQKLSFKGLSMCDPSTGVESDLSIASTMIGPFTLPKGLKKLTLGGHIEACAIILNGIVIPATCNVRLLIGANRQSETEAPNPETVRECASQFANLWLTDVGNVPCVEVGLIFDQHRRTDTCLEKFLGVSHASETRRIDVIFAQTSKPRMPVLIREFANQLAGGPSPLFIEESFLKLRASMSGYVVEWSAEHYYTDTIRILLGQWRSIKNVDISRYDGARNDELGIFAPSLNSVLKEVSFYRIYEPIVSDLCIVESPKVLVYADRDDRKFKPSNPFADFVLTERRKDKNFLKLYQ